MADESQVLVRLKLLGAALMARDAKRSADALRQVDSGARSAQRGLSTIKGGRVQGELSRVQRGAEVAKGHLAGLGGAGLAVGRGLRTGLGAAGVAAAAGIGYAAKKTADFDQQMANVQAKLLTTPTDMAKLRSMAMDMGAKTQFSASQAAGAMDELAAQGFTTRQIMGTLPGTLSLAAATGVELADAAAIQTETLHGFGLAAGDAGRVADVLAQTANRSAADIDSMQESIKYIAPVAKASGQSLTDMMTAVGLMSNVGIKGSQAGTTLRTAIVRLTKPTDAARSALGTMGLKAGDLVGKKGLLSMPNILSKVVRGSQGLSKNMRNQALATIFGREALSGMVALVEGGPKKFDRMAGALENSRGAAQRAAGIMRNTVKGAWDNFTGSVETAAIALSERFQPAIKDALNAGAGAVNRGVGAVSDFVGAAQGRVGKGTASQAGSGLRAGLAGKTESETAGFSGAGKIGVQVGGALRSVGDQAKRLGPILLGAGQQLVDAFRPAMPFIQNVLLPLLQGVAEGVIGGIVMAFKIAVPVIRVVATVLGAVGRVLAPFRGVFRAIGQVIGMLIGGPVLQFLGTFRRVGIVFRLLRAPIAIANGALRGIASAALAVGRGFMRGFTFVSRFVGFMGGLAGRVGRAAVNVVGAVIHAFESMPGKVAGFAKSVGSRLVSGVANSVRSRIGSLASFMGRIGKNIVTWVVDAVKAAPGAISGALLSLIPGGKVRDAVAGVLGIDTHAAGGLVRSPLQIVGERGPELAALPVGSRVVPAGDTRRMMRPRAAGTPMLDGPTGGPLFANLVVQLDGRELHRGVYRVERQQEEAR